MISSEEQCDDGNQDNNDGCSSSCSVESGWQCDNTPLPSTCTVVCGDVILISSHEQCDDGNGDNSDGCDSN